MNLHPVAILSALFASEGKPPHKAAALATYVCRLGKQVAKTRLAEINGELIPGERDNRAKYESPERYHIWNEEICKAIAAKKESVDAKVESLNAELRELGLEANAYGNGGLYLTISGKDTDGFRFNLRIA